MRSTYRMLQYTKKKKTETALVLTEKQKYFLKKLTHLPQDAPLNSISFSCPVPIFS